MPRRCRWRYARCPLVWRNAANDIGATALGGPNSQAFGINDRGQVVGTGQTSDPNGEDFCGFNAVGLTLSATACRGFLWQNGGQRPLCQVAVADFAAAR